MIFIALGLTFEGRAPIEGDWAGDVTGLPGQRVEIAMMRTPDAHSRLEGFAYDALVVDLTLPDGNGMNVLRFALDRYPAIRAIVITGFGGVEEAVEAIRLGAVDFLIKPFQLLQVARELQQAIEQRRLQRQNAELRARLRDRFSFENVIGRHSSISLARIWTGLVP